MELWAWIKRLFKPDDEDDILEDYDEPEVMTWIRPDKRDSKSRHSDKPNND